MKDNNYPISVYLQDSEREYLDELAKALSVSRHSIMQFAVRHFLNEYKAGNIAIPIETKTTSEIVY